MRKRAPTRATRGFSRRARIVPPAHAGRLGGGAGGIPEVTKVSALAEVMVAVDERWDRLKAVHGADWQAPPGHADLDPPHEAMQLRQQFREAKRSTDHAAHPTRCGRC